MFPALVDVVFYRPRNRRNIRIIRIHRFIGMAVVARFSENRSDMLRRFENLYKIHFRIHRFIRPVHRNELDHRNGNQKPIENIEKGFHFNLRLGERSTQAFPCCLISNSRLPCSATVRGFQSLSGIYIHPRQKFYL